MQYFFAVAGWVVVFSAIASCSELAECDTNDDENSMLQLTNQHDADRAELLALQRQVHDLSELESEQIDVFSRFLAWASDTRLSAIRRLPQILREFAVVKGYEAAWTHGAAIAGLARGAAENAQQIQGDSSAGASLRSYLEGFSAVIDEASQVGDGYPEGVSMVLSAWCPGLTDLARDIAQLFQTQGRESNDQARREVEDAFVTTESLLQGVDMKQFQTQTFSAEQTIALKKRLHAMLNGLETQEEFIRTMAASLETWCTNLQEQCPATRFSIMSASRRIMLEKCVESFGEIAALGEVLRQ